MPRAARTDLTRPKRLASRNPACRQQRAIAARVHRAAAVADLCRSNVLLVRRRCRLQRGQLAPQLLLPSPGSRQLSLSGSQLLVQAEHLVIGILHTTRASSLVRVAGALQQGTAGQPAMQRQVARAASGFSYALPGWTAVQPALRRQASRHPCRAWTHLVLSAARAAAARALLCLC